ncbi:hypothetical protein RHMOL_Rhmol04G0021300 [Rhododendron molle]|uniref:Uncharacterized protein n=1 Tax=Rhododendron molle TaxID=49168 RepID=A0ACC0NXU1_RHOML|nr:hypothetical protein RHMOL_Rhmol04G0021300 [Rhododendron molle]
MKIAEEDCRNGCRQGEGIAWPGCLSIVYGMAEELGPFHIDRDGKTLYLNPYAWNQVSLHRPSA